jgi:hypothetical protein
MGLTTTYFDPICTHRPLIVQEFASARRESELQAHQALAAGAVAGITYEWGVSWLAREQSFYPTPLREGAEEAPDPRFFAPYLELGKVWPRQGVGICPTPSGFPYGSLYHGTPFPAEGSVAIGRFGLIGSSLARAFRPEQVYVLIPTAKNDHLEAAWQVLRGLWREKVPFGTWHEDCLDDLPETTRVLLCPDGVTSPESPPKLDALRRSGVQVFVGSGEEWQEAADLPRLPVTPKEGVDLLIRRTVEGTLYSLFSEPPVETVALGTEGGSVVTLGLTAFALVHERDSGLGLMESSGEVTLNGQWFGRIEQGRAVLVSEDDRDLTTCQRTRVVVTEPTRIEFRREIASCQVWEEGRDGPLGIIPMEGKVLDIDSEMKRYVLRLEWRKGASE